MVWSVNSNVFSLDPAHSAASAKTLLTVSLGVEEAHLAMKRLREEMRKRTLSADMRMKSPNLQKWWSLTLEVSDIVGLDGWLNSRGDKR